MLGPLIHARPVRAALSAALLAATASAGSAAAMAPAPVAPGATDRATMVASLCPTFSWATPSGSDAVTLEVYEAIEPGRSGSVGATEASPVLEVALPEGAHSWTPSGDHCLEPDAAYVWFVRRTTNGQPAQRSEGHLFRIQARMSVTQPSAAEVAWAEDVLRRHLRQPTPAPRLDDRTGTGSPALAQGEHQSQTVDPPRAGKALTGTPSALRVKGRLEVKELRAVAIPPDFAGDVIAEGDISAPSGAMASPRITVTGGFGDIDLYTLRATGPGEVTVCRAGAACDTSPAPDATGVARVGRLWANGSIAAIPGGMTVAGPYTWHGSGGSGFFEIPSAVNVNVDDNYSRCPGGGVAVGVRLWETDNNQIGIQVRCSE